jgi:hypothetical protein
MATDSLGTPSVAHRSSSVATEQDVLFEGTFQAKLEQLRPVGKPIPIKVSPASSQGDGEYSFAITMTDGQFPMTARSVLYNSQSEANRAREQFTGARLRKLVVVDQAAEDGLCFIRIVVDDAGEQEVIARLGEHSVEQASKVQDLARQSIKLAIRDWESTLPQVKIFRERDGSFRLKVVDAAGKDLAESVPLQSNQSARQLRDDLLDAHSQVLERDALIVASCDGGYRFTVHLPADAPVMHGPVVPTEDECRVAYARFEAARAALAAARM